MSYIYKIDFLKLSLLLWNSLQSSNRELRVLAVHLKCLEIFAGFFDQFRNVDDLEGVNRSDVRIDRRHRRLPASSDRKNPSGILKLIFHQKYIKF